MRVSLVFADRRRTLVGVLLLGGCLPRGDLTSYSEGNAQEQPSEQQVTPALTPAPESDLGNADTESNAGSPTPGESESAPSLVNLVPPDAPDEQGTAGSADLGADAGTGTVDGGVSGPSPAAEDAGATRAAPADAGTVVASTDAGNGAAEACSSAGGTLAPDTRTCVFIAAEQLSWPAAVSACAAQGRQLISVKSPALDNFLTPLLSADVWIGARDPVMLNPASNAFVWLDGTPAISTNWALGEPDAQANQYCVTKTSAAPTGPWRDRSCDTLQPYVCEQSF